MSEGISIRTIRLREWSYLIFRAFLVVDRQFRKQTITIINPPPKEKKKVIFACAHIGENDSENIYEKLGWGCWWFVGDPASCTGIFPDCSCI